MLKLGLEPSYVLDNMSWYEVKGLLDYQYYKDKENWEQTRLIAYIVAQCNSTKKLKIEDIVKFPWERAETKGEMMTDAELKNLKQKAKAFIENNMI